MFSGGAHGHINKHIKWKISLSPLSLLKLLAELAPEEVSLKSRLSSWITAQSVSSSVTSRVPSELVTNWFFWNPKEKPEDFVKLTSLGSKIKLNIL
jgi:hypothetical protein